MVILKLGAEGSLIKHKTELVRVKAVVANPVDTTGAGDLYAAGFLYGLINSLSLKKCGDIGALLSARVIEVVGPKMGEVRWEAIRREIQALNN
jgi:sugar/nucleoside kinase (ribokinase family)